MSAERDPFAAVRADADALDALAASPALRPELGGDPALALLAALRAEVDASLVTSVLGAVRRDALLLDAVAAGRLVEPGTDVAASLLASLRAHADALPGAARAPALLPLVARSPAAAAGGLGRAGLGRAGLGRAGLGRAGPGRAGSRRLARAGVVVIALAGGLSTSGVAAAALASHPGGSLYGLRAAVFGRTADDPEVPRQLLRQAQREYDLAESTGGTAGVAHLRASQGLVAQARLLLPRVSDTRAVPVLAADAVQLTEQLATTSLPLRGPAGGGSPGGASSTGGTGSSAGRAPVGPVAAALPHLRTSPTAPAPTPAPAAAAPGNTGPVTQGSPAPALTAGPTSDPAGEPSGGPTAGPTVSADPAVGGTPGATTPAESTSPSAVPSSDPRESATPAVTSSATPGGGSPPPITTTAAAGTAPTGPTLGSTAARSTPTARAPATARPRARVTHRREWRRPNLPSARGPQPMIDTGDVPPAPAP